MHNEGVIHYDFEKSMPSSLKKAADWAWSCYEHLCLSFCMTNCIKKVKCKLPTHLESHSHAGFEEAQEAFHEALAYLPVIEMPNDECPACTVAKALHTFPLIAARSEVTPVSEIKMNGVDCYSEVVPMGANTKRSFPCCIVNTWVGDSEHVIENRCREMVLLNLDIDELPSMPPWEYEKIEHSFLQGQTVVKRLWAIKQGEPEEEIKKSELFEYNLNNAIAATICLRDLLRANVFYPGAIPEDDFSSLERSLLEWINHSVENEPLLKKIYSQLFKDESSEATNPLDTLSAFCSVMLLHHPDMLAINADSGKTKESISEVMNKCLGDSLQPIKEARDYIVNAKLRSYIYPTPEGNAQYRSTSRYFTMLREYWMLCQKAVTDRTNHHVAWHPYPLSTIVINLKHRIDTCIKGMSETGFDISPNIQSDMDDLVEALLHWDVDEFSIGREDLLNKIQSVALWIEETDIQVGRSLSAMIPEEQTYIEYAHQLFEKHNKDAKAAFQKMLSNADKQAAQYKKDTQPESPKEKNGETFPLPQGAKWSELTLKFSDGHVVTVKFQEKRKRFTYAQMGMVCSKSGNPTKQWELLRAFAESYGQIDWQNRFASDKLKKQKQELSKRLREFFRLEDDPIEWIKGKKTYRCRFKVLSDNADDY